MTTAPPAARWTRPGTRGQDTEFIPFAADDGVPLLMLHVTRPGAETPRGPVMLVHGAGVRAEIFRPPLEHTLVDALLDDGFDVWLLNWRASIDLRPVAWTLDDAAAYDYPAAVRLVLSRTGAATLKAFVHCQGSTSFMISAISGLIPEVTTIVTNAVSLHTVLPPWSAVKIRVLSPAVRHFSPTLSPKWGYKTEGRFSRALRTAVTLTHPECRNPVCAMVSFTYGAGHPALWAHRNIDRATHDWLAGEFAGSPMTFFAQMRDCVRVGHLVPAGEVPRIAPDLLAEPKTDARFVFLAGADNRCFLAEGQRRSFAHFDALAPGRHVHHEFAGYGHLDVIFGANAWRDTHPVIVDELRR
ncbi:esterase [Microbacterium aureliae]